MFRKNQAPDLKSTIDQLYSELQGYEAHSKEYAQIVDQISKLTSLKTQTRRQLPSPDVWVTAGANLLAVLIIVNYEQMHVVTSKAMTLVKTIR